MNVHALFDTALNALLAFAVSAAVVLLAERLLRPRKRAASPALSALLLAVPFAKGALEVIRGVPDGAFFWAFERGARQELGSFQLGLGLGPGRINLAGLLYARADGHVYPTSLGELLARGARLSALGWLVDGIGILCATVAAGLVLRRLVAAARFEVRRRRRRSEQATLVTPHLGMRRVDIYIDDHADGSPFAGGLWAPYVCIPRRAYERLTENELEAVIAHELAHIRRFDVVLTSLVALATDVLWFCPGARMLFRRYTDTVERAADESAVRAGLNPLLLASALVRVAESAGPSRHGGFVTAAADTGSGSAAKRRIRALVERLPSPPSDWRSRLRTGVRIGWVLLIANTVLFAVFLGNHG